MLKQMTATVCESRTQPQCGQPIIKKKKRLCVDAENQEKAKTDTYTAFVY